MAHAFQGNDCDSAYGGDDYHSWPDPMFPVPAPLAGSKRDANSAIVSEPKSTAPGLAADTGIWAEQGDPSAQSTRDSKPGCPSCEDGRPSKRKAAAVRVGEYHNVAADQPTTNSDQQFPDLCFEQFCQGVPKKTHAGTPIARKYPAPITVSIPNARRRPTSTIRASVRSAMLNHVHLEIRITSVTSLTLRLLGQAPSTATTTHDVTSRKGNTGMILSCLGTKPIRVTLRLMNRWSILMEPLTPLVWLHPYYRPCYLNIPIEHCHIDNSCCHGESRACGDCPTAPQEHLDVWNASIAEGNGLANNFLNFGLHTGQPATAFSLGSSNHNMSMFDDSLNSPMYGFNDTTWLLPQSHYSDAFQSVGPDSTKIDFNLSAARLETPKPEQQLLLPSGNRPSSNGTGTSDVSTEDPQTCVCKWQHAPGLLCLAVFPGPESLHKHIKATHVDNCTHCVCQWEGCEASSKDFKQRSKLSRHLLAHAGHRPYACSFAGCNKTFATNQAKDNHERTHTGERPYVCDRCGYTTTTHTQLQTHISALHEGKKPHKCRFCDFSCADSSNLSKHERTHQVPFSSHCCLDS
ncbi:zinc-finger protein [Kalmusia sp. IMI 367209]|nr:zinc-finger protein [Kalmusia sp. IMI 367209]